MSAPADETLSVDVLVIGGGPAGAWAAWSAASHGARTVLADKGYLGTSGATAPGGTNFLYVEPNDAKRSRMVEERLDSGGGLSEGPWIYRLMEQAYLNIQLVEKWGYRFPLDDHGNLYKAHMQGPEYMELMRRVVRKAGVHVLDQHPALELLSDEHGVGGARGVNRLNGRSWEVRAHAVIIATGGCAFLSKGLGCNVQTGDGQLMVSELGVEMSGMEFSRQYATTAAFGTITRNRLLSFASFYNEQGELVHEGGPRGDHFFSQKVEARQRELHPAGRHGLAHTAVTSDPIPVREVISRVQQEMFPLRINYFRSEPVLAASLERLNQLWPLVQGSVSPGVTAAVQSREAAAMVVNARWMYTAALLRKETRGMHTMAEYPTADERLAHRLLLSGTDRITHRPEYVKARGGTVLPSVIVKERQPI